MLLNAWVAAALGVGVAGISALIAWFGLRWSARRPGLVFVAVLGGTLVRLMFVAGASILLLYFHDVHRTGYAAGLIIAYLLFLGIEIVYVARSARYKEAKTPPS